MQLVASEIAGLPVFGHAVSEPLAALTVRWLPSRDIRRGGR